MEIVWQVWAGVACLGFLEALYSLREGLLWAREMRRAARGESSSTTGSVAVIVPCAGIDPGLESNLNAYCRQDYPNYRLVFVTRDAEDAAVEVIRSLQLEHARLDIQLLFAGPAQRRGQKVHNLLQAVKGCLHSEILAFGDSDIRPLPDWLAGLVGGLQDEAVGASTGFRWYLPPRVRWASRLRASWNAGIVGLLRMEDSPFAWGGAMAMTQERFRECRVAEFWRHSLSDDLSLTRAVQARGLKVSFTPRALSFSHEGCSLAEFWSWSFRQLAITRVYNPPLWRLAWVAQLLNSLTLWGGTALLVLALLQRLAMFRGGLTLALAGSVFLLGALKAELRLQAVAHLFPEHRRALLRDRWGFRLLGPVTSLFTLAALVRSLFHHEIEWRGIRYRMLSAEDTVIVGQEIPELRERPSEQE